MERSVGLKRASSFGRGARRWRRLGEILTSQRVITRVQLLTALDRQADLSVSGRPYPLGRVLVTMGYASTTEVDTALSKQARQSAPPPSGRPETDGAHAPVNSVQADDVGHDPAGGVE